VLHRIRRSKCQTRFILCEFDGYSRLLFALSHIFSYFFYARQAIPVRILPAQGGESYQNHQENDHQMFMLLLYSNQMGFSSFSPILFKFSLKIHPFIFWHFTYQHTFGLYHLVDRFCLWREF
jgi:hypothetical protein